MSRREKNMWQGQENPSSNKTREETNGEVFLESSLIKLTCSYRGKPVPL